MQWWALLLSNYDYEILYHPSSKYSNANLLLRLPAAQDSEFDSSENACLHIDSENSETLQNFPLDFCHIAQATATDSDLHVILRFASTSWLRASKDIDNSAAQRYFAHRQDIVVQ